MGTYTHTPGATTELEYNVPVYVNETMAPGEHSMLIQPVNTGVSVLTLFDYFIYTCVLCLVLRQVVLMGIPLAQIHRIQLLSHHLPQQHPPRHLPQQHPPRHLTRQHRPQLKERLWD